MNREEAIAIIRKEYLCVDRDCDIERNCGKCDLMMPSKEPILEAYKMAIKALEQEPCRYWQNGKCNGNTEVCEDAISRAEAVRVVSGYCHPANVAKELAKLPPVTPQPKTGHCKDCKYFEYDSVAKVDGIPLIVAHEICSKWGDGCKTKEDGYCFLYEPQERSDKK